MTKKDLNARLLAAAASGGRDALERVIEVWDQQNDGSRTGLTDALVELERRGLLELKAMRDGDHVQIQGIVALAQIEPDGGQEDLDAHQDLSLATPLARDRRAVFVIHGRDSRLRESLFQFLRAIDLRPLEWSQLVADFGEGVPYIGDLLDRAFATAQAVVVLMSPDEEVSLRDELARGDPEVGRQARPNVLFEAGMAIGRDPSHTIIVEVGSVRAFSDVAGRHVVRLNDDGTSAAIAARQDLAQRLRALGCPVEISGTDWYDAGTFKPTDG